jgi:Chorismate pyruvate-lyase Rv2949c-like
VLVACTASPADDHSVVRLRALTDPAEIIAAQNFTAVQRMVAVSDGTITQLIEAFLGEPLEPAWIRQMSSPLSTDRRILLAGTRSGRPVIFAHSSVEHPVLPAPARADFLAGDKPIGEILRAHQLPTTRIVRRAWLETAHEVLDDGSQAVALAREYVICVRQQEVFRVTEHFAPCIR